MKVKLDTGAYVDWKWQDKNDKDRMEEFTKTVMVEGWKGIRDEYKVLKDIPEGYLPKFVFIEGFEEALKICGSENPEYELDPHGDEKGEIEIEWCGWLTEVNHE